MAFKMDCPHCKRTLNVTEKAFGKTVPCPGCNQPIQVPQPKVAVPVAVRPPERPSAAAGGTGGGRTAEPSPTQLPPGMPPMPALPAGMPPVPEIARVFAPPRVVAGKRPSYALNGGREAARRFLIFGGAAGTVLLLGLLLVYTVLPMLSGHSGDKPARKRNVAGSGVEKKQEDTPASNVGEAVDNGFQGLRQATSQSPLPPAFVGIIAAISIIGGLVECFFGYRIFMVTLAIVGFLIGAVLAGAIGAAQSHEPVVALLSAIVGGFIGAVLMIVLHFVGVFVLGALLGGLLGAMLCAAANSKPEPAILMIPAVMGGIAALLVRKFMIILATSFSGAWSVVTGVAYFTTITIDRSNILAVFWPGRGYLFPLALCWVALGIFGMFVQYKMVPLSPTEPAPAGSG